MLEMVVIRVIDVFAVDVVTSVIDVIFQGGVVCSRHGAVFCGKVDSFIGVDMLGSGAICSSIGVDSLNNGVF